jgi:hypothetical protein
MMSIGGGGGAVLEIENPALTACVLIKMNETPRLSYSLNDNASVVSSAAALSDAATLEPQLSENGGAVPAASSELPAAPSLGSAPSTGPVPSLRMDSILMLSAPGEGRGTQRTGTFTSSLLIYITSCFGCSCLAMPWVSEWDRSSM